MSSDADHLARPSSLTFDGAYISPARSSWKRFMGGIEGIGVVQSYPGLIHVEGNTDRLFKNVTGIRLLRSPFPWVLMVVSPVTCFAMYELGVFKSLRPDEPLFWVTMVSLIGLMVYGWWISRRFEMQYLDDEGNSQTAILIPFDQTRKKIHPHANELFVQLHEIVLGRSPSAEERIPH